MTDEQRHGRDITEVPGTLPAPSLPSLSLVGVLIVPAVSLAFVGVPRR